MITRQQAIDTLCEILNTGILEQSLEDDLEDILSCIEAEEYCIHAWGMDDNDYLNIETGIVDGIDAEEFEKHVEEILRFHSFVPSEAERCGR